MDTSWIGPVISAVGNIGGGLASSRGGSGDGFSKKGAGQSLAFQVGAIPQILKAYKKAGIHPLAALGSPGFNANPVSIGGTGSFGTDFGVGNALNQMGQDISRAIGARETPYERQKKQLDLQYSQALIDNARLNGQLLTKKLLEEDRNQPTTPLKINDLGEVQSGSPVVAKAAEVIPVDPRTGYQVGTPAAQRNYRLGKDWLFPAKTEEVGEATEDDAFSQTQLFGYNIGRYFKGIGGSFPPYPSEDPGPGYRWKYKPWAGMYKREPIYTYRSRKRATDTGRRTKWKPRSRRTYSHRNRRGSSHWYY